MRYNIIFNQLGLQKYNENNQDKQINFIDAILLNVIFELSKWKDINTKTFGNKKYYWISYKKILDEIPTIPLNKKDTLAKRYKKLAEYSLIEKKIDKKDNSKTYFRLTTIGLEYVTYRTDIRLPIGQASDCLSDRHPTNNITNNKKTNNERELSHFDFLNTKHEKEIKELKTKYNLDSEQWRLCIGGFNDKELKKITLNSLERYISRWKSHIKNPKKTNDTDSIIYSPMLKRVN